jgi:hypothetical protein
MQLLHMPLIMKVECSISFDFGGRDDNALFPTLMGIVCPSITIIDIGIGIEALGSFSRVSLWCFTHRRS